MNLVKNNNRTSWPFSPLFNRLKKTSAILVCLMGLLLTACGGGSDNGTGPDPDPEPDPNPDRNVSFAEDIQPIFNGNCAVSGCHNSQSQESGVNLSSYSDALNSVGEQYGENVINPDNPDGSPLVDKISNDDPQFGARMPESRPPLGQAEIDSIRAWIEDGAPNN